MDKFNLMSYYRQSFYNRFFEGLNWHWKSNKYITMNRASDDNNRCVVKVSGSHLFKTKYGYGLILNASTVCWLKDWQVNDNYYGIEVMLSREFFKPVTWGNHSNFSDDKENLSFDAWLNVAKEQDAQTDDEGNKLNPVKWVF